MKKWLRIFICILLFIVALTAMVIAQLSSDYPLLFGTSSITRLVFIVSWVVVILCDAGIFFLILPLTGKSKK